MRKTHLILLFFLTAVFVSSCVRDDFPEQSAGEVPAQTEKEGSVRSGRLPNPYSVANMQRAYEALTGLPSTRAGGLLDADHYHVRFVPFDDDQYYELTADESIDFYPYPLDADVPEGAISYLDDLQVEDAPPVLYACVPVDYIFPAGVPYEIIEELILAGMDEEETGTSGDGGITIGQITLMSGGNLVPDIDPIDPLCPGVGEVPGVFTCERPEPYTTDPWTPPTEPDDPDDPGTGEGEGDPRDPVGGDGTEIDELPIIGNPIGSGGGSGGSGGSSGNGGSSGGSSGNGENTGGIIFSSNKPHGRITVWDDLLQRHIPLEGVKVVVRKNMFKSYRVKTNSAGCFQISDAISSDKKKTYKIKWETDHYDIRDGGMIQAFYKGPDMKSNTWNMDLGDSTYTSGRSHSFRYATIHRAAYRWFYKNIGGLERPVRTRKLKIRYKDQNRSSTNGNYSGEYLGGINSDIRIFRSSGGDNRTTDQIFSTTVHEIGHSAHCTGIQVPGPNMFLLVKACIRESWARFVEWVLTPLEYEELGLNTQDLNRLRNRRAIQGWDGTDEDLEDYSSLFIDLVDDFNQRTVNNDTNLPDDNVTGYTVSQLNHILLRVLWVSGLKSKLKDNKPEGVTDNDLDVLFQRFDAVWGTD